MIFFNSKEINPEKFGDGSLKLVLPEFSAFDLCYPKITWLYENDSEMFVLLCLVNEIRAKKPNIDIRLSLPYIPNARQDRYVSGRVFSLKWFAQFINSLNFQYVEVLDPHSDVSTALLDRVKLIDISESFLDLGIQFDAIMYPDAGAEKRYSDFTKLLGKEDSVIIGNKHRNSEGRIDRYDLLNFKEGVESVLIRDDICSYGGTFVEAAKALRAKGVKNIYLFVSHCENNIEKGEVFNYIDKVFTTDSICTVKNEKIQYISFLSGGKG